jgi:uncharacterized membrane protein YuzA (DUF378 family)
MKVLYIIIILVVIVIIFLGGSIYSTTSTVKNTLASAASELQGQRGGKKASNLRTVFYLILAIAAVIFILSKLNK